MTKNLASGKLKKTELYSKVTQYLCHFLLPSGSNVPRLVLQLSFNEKSQHF
jgi:hypothetical protein